MKIMKFLAIALAVVGLTAATEASAAAPSTADFIRKATVGNGFEILSSRIALQRSRNPEVRDFAQRMIDVHSEADDNLRDAVRESGFRMRSMPNNLDTKHRRIIDRLEASYGPDFDRRYIQAQVQAHNEAAALYRNYVRSGQNRSLRSFAAETLPLIQEHKDHVRHIRMYR